MIIKLNEASKEVLKAIINLGGQGKIFEEDQVDDRSI